MSPNIFKFKFGVDVIIPVINLASVPEFPKFNFDVFFALYEPNPFPKILYVLFPIFKIFIFNFLKQFIVENTSSDSRTLFNDEMP